MEKLCAFRVKMNSLTQRTQRLYNPSTRERGIDRLSNRKRENPYYLLPITY